MHDDLSSCPATRDHHLHKQLNCNLQKKIETLQDAAKAGDQEALRKMLAEGADVNGKDERGITALGVAVGFNKISVVDTLLEAGADVELTDPKGNTALHYAAGSIPSLSCISASFFR